MRPRIYADTSALGGCEDEEFREPSLRLLEAFVRGELTLVLSELTLRELDVAPTEVRRHVASVPEAHVEALSVSSEAEELAAAYIADGAVRERMLADALHIALASVARVDVLVSWNFKHIVNLRRIRAYNAVNLKHGYPLLEIRTPREVPGNE
ncbi:MAG: PIN domain protein [Candidatus Rokubacteria bacterium GWC2_70_24]|nr:MAG: PIN domain protein [Candidatus Rokubacteria bacterium GWC2_70_24]HAM54893.1 PIN domain protein [Candidatus Rokubacteria bacterium]